jgi:hypothetical protein
MLNRLFTDQLQLGLATGPGGRRRGVFGRAAGRAAKDPS